MINILYKFLGFIFWRNKIW